MCTSVVLICISLMTGQVDCVPSCLFTNQIPFWTAGILCSCMVFANATERFPMWEWSTNLLKYGERGGCRNSIGFQEGRSQAKGALGSKYPTCRQNPTGTCAWQSFSKAPSHLGTPSILCLKVGTHHSVLCLGCSSCIGCPFPLSHH